MNATVSTHPARREIMQIIEKTGAAAPPQIAKATGSCAVRRHLYVLRRGGRVKSVRTGPFTYNFVRAAAEVVSASACPDVLSLGRREKLDLLASGV